MEARQLAADNAEIDAGVVGDEYQPVECGAQVGVDFGDCECVGDLIVGDSVEASRHRGDCPWRPDEVAPPDARLEPPQQRGTSMTSARAIRSSA